MKKTASLVALAAACLGLATLSPAQERTGAVRVSVVPASAGTRGRHD